MGIELTWNRLKILYHFQEYLKILNQNSQLLSKYWIEVLQKLPDLIEKQLPTISSTKVSKSNATESESKSFSEPKVSMANISKNTENTSQKNNEIISVERKESYTFPLIGGWKTQSSQSETSTKLHSVPKWKNNVPVTSSVC